MQSLQERLDAFKAEFESGAPPYNVSADQVQVMHDFDDELRASGILRHMAKVGDRFPGFRLKDENGNEVASDDLLARGPLVVSFFRGVWCPYCNIELKALQEVVADIEATGATLVSVSPQLPASNRKAIRENGLSFSILSDEGNRLAQELGIAYRLGDEVKEKVYLAFGTQLPLFNGDDSWRLPLSSRFVIDTDGTSVAGDADPDYRVRPEPTSTIALLRAITRRKAA